MRRMILHTMCAVMATALMWGTAFAAPPDSAVERPKRKIVIFQDDVRESERGAIVRQHGGRVKRKVSRFRGLAIEMDKRQEKVLRRHKKVKAIYDDLELEGNAITFTPVQPPAVEGYSWAQQMLGIPTVHTLLAGQTFSTVRVAVIDSGIDLNHPELQNDIVGGFNTLSTGGPDAYGDDNGHGTHMAGIISAAVNGQGMRGMVMHPHLLAVKVLDHEGKGYLSDLLEGLNWVLENNVQVVNMSLSVKAQSPLLEEAVQALADAGVIMVAAVGNKCKEVIPTDSGGDDSGGDDSGGDDSGGDDSGGDDSGGDDSGGDDASNTTSCDPQDTSVKYPARYAATMNIIAVGGTDGLNNIARYSRSGPEITLVAPGGSSLNDMVLSTITNGAYAYGTGTSQATAYVSGAIAVLLQLDPTLSHGDILSLMQTTAIDLGHTQPEQGLGLLNVYGMVQTFLGNAVP